MDKFISEYCHVAYHEEDHLVVVTYKKFCYHDTYRMPFMFASRLLKQHSGTQLVLDIRRGLEVTKEDSDWTFDELLPALASTDCKKCVFLIEEPYDFQEELKLWMSEFQDYFEVEQVFSYEEAKQRI